MITDPYLDALTKETKARTRNRLTVSPDQDMVLNFPGKGSTLTRIVQGGGGEWADSDQDMYDILLTVIAQGGEWRQTLITS